MTQLQTMRYIVLVLLLAVGGINTITGQNDLRFPIGYILNYILD